MDIWFKENRDNRYLIYNGSAFRFNFLGVETGNNLPLTSNITSGAVSVNVVSLLKSGVSSVEVGINLNGDFGRFGVSMSFEAILSLLTKSGSFVGLLRRIGCVSGVHYTQVLLVYPKVVNINSIFESCGIILKRL